MPEGKRQLPAQRHQSWISGPLNTPLPYDTLLAGNQVPTQHQLGKRMKDIVIAISGMSCGHCLNAVNQALATVPGIEVSSVRIGRAELRIPESPAVTEQVTAAITEAGYKVEGITG